MPAAAQPSAGNSRRTTGSTGSGTMLSSGRRSFTSGAQRRGRSHAIAGLKSARRSTRSGIVNAISIPIRPPMLLPTTWAFDAPAASSTSAMTFAK